MHDPIDGPRLATSPGPSRRGLRETFQHDHARLDLLYQELLAAFAADDREGVAARWSAFDSGLLAHMAAEERHMLPAFAKSHPSESAALRSDHASIRSRLAELGVGVDLHLVNLEHARLFVDELKRHAKIEDELLYQWAEQELSLQAKGSVDETLRDVAKFTRKPR